MRDLPEVDSRPVFVTRAYEFNAGHRLFNPDHDDAWNLRVFGKCSYPGGHGHNYRLEVTVRGPVDPETGFAIHLDDLDSLVKRQVVEPIDHRNLNEVLELQVGVAPTTEVLAVEKKP